MTDKRGPIFAWLCAVLVTIATLLIAAGAARAVHAQSLSAAVQQNGRQGDAALRTTTL